MATAAPVHAPRALPRRARVVPAWAVSLVALFSLLMFLLFLASNAVEDKLLQASYYNGVLDHADAYNRAYAELGNDPALAPQVSGLLGGEDLAFIDDIPGELIGAVAPDLVRTVVQATIEKIVDFMKNEDHLDLTLDVTPIYETVGLGSFFGADFNIFGSDPSDEVAAIPSRRMQSYDQFKTALEQVVDDARESKQLPPSIPIGPVSERRYDEVTEILVDRSGLSEDPGANGSAIDDIRSSVEDDETLDAIRLALTALTAELAPPSTEVSPQAENLLGAEFITKVGEGESTRYLLGPPDDVRKDIEDAFSIVHFISWMAPFGRAVSLILLLGGLGGMVYMRRAQPRAATRWVGGVLLVGGAIGFFGWLIGRTMAQDRVLDLTLGDGADVPPSFQQLWRDIVHQAGSDLTPAFWLPAVVALVVGLALVGLTYSGRVRSNRPPAA